MHRHTESANPATGEILGTSVLHTVEELKSMKKRASEAQINWSEIRVKHRCRYILKIRDYLVENSEKISEVISRDTGKTRVDALATEIMPAAMAISYYCKNAPHFLKEKKLSGGNFILINKRSKIIHQPFGVIGIISPWNYPLSIPISEVIMALLAGNSVILKTASETQMVGLILKEAIDFAGLPVGVFNYINLPGKIAGDSFIDCGVDKIFFTGSVPVGKYLMEKAAKHLIPVTLELGGNDAMIVCEDADPYRAAMGALWAGFQNAGQSCAGVERIYVHDKIYDPFMKILKEKVETLKVNYCDDFDSDMGCMTTERQIDLVNRHLKDATAKGAKLFAQSKIPNDKKYKNFIPATVLTDVSHEMEIMIDETFGPVVGVMRFSDYEEAINLANDSYLGLTGSVWTKNSKRGEELGKKIKAGVVTINDHLISHGLAETPWGGIKQSGINRTHGEIGFMEMTQPLVIVTDILPFVKKNLWWHPYSKKIFDGLKGVLDFLYAKRINIRFRGFKNLLKILPRIFKEE